MTKFKFIEQAHQQERRRIFKKMIPSFIRMGFNYWQNTTRYPGRYISSGTKIINGARIGLSCVINESTIGATTSLGDFTTINHRCRFGGSAAINVGKFCSIGPECLFWTDNHDVELFSTYPFDIFLTGKTDREVSSREITIGNDVWFGQRVIVLPGASIGDGCVVAAGAVVPGGHYPPYTIIGGIPARVIRQRLSQDKIEKLIADPWWEKSPEKIFGPLMDFLHQK